ncbi:hypothetical protein [Clostridium baratii]|uniref:hypothetical protein n=1 Tax=Clostridium baratii TaxID=1561 RepID=UPI0024307158|nr:hypothetical protein [Clostridium baratii]
MKKCIYCNREISLKYLLKQEKLDKIKCPYCTKEVKASKISKLLFISLLVLVITLMVIFPLKLYLKLLFISIWIVVCEFILKAIIYVYE